MVVSAFGFAACFGYLMTLMQIPMRVTAFFTGISDNPYVILLLILAAPAAFGIARVLARRAAATVPSPVA